MVSLRLMFGLLPVHTYGTTLVYYPMFLYIYIYIYAGDVAKIALQTKQYFFVLRVV